MTNENDLTCGNDAQNLKDVEQIFGLTDGALTSTKRSSRQQPITTVTTLEKLSYRLRCKGAVLFIFDGTQNNETA